MPCSGCSALHGVNPNLKNVNSTQNGVFPTFWHGKLCIKRWCNSKNLCEYFQFFLCDGKRFDTRNSHATLDTRVFLYKAESHASDHLFSADSC